MRAALYSRISTKDRGQDTENQAHLLREFCVRNGYQIVAEYSDQSTGSKSDRAQFLELFEGARRRDFDVVVFWALDRFTREGVLKTFEHLEKLTQCGVLWRSYTEPMFDTTGPMRELLIALFAWIAKQERERIRERVNAGLDRARREGKTLGPRRRIFDREAVRAYYAETQSLRKTAAHFKLSKDTIARVLA